MARQGVAYPTVAGLMVADPETMTPVPQDGKTMGELMMRGNTVMKGYLANPDVNEQDAGRRLVSVGRPGGVAPGRLHRDQGPVEGHHHLGRGKHLHPGSGGGSVAASRGAVGSRGGSTGSDLGRNALRFPGTEAGIAEVSETEIIQFCRQSLARFKVPKRVVFGELPKTSTGKIQKFTLRERAAGHDGAAPA